MLAFSDRTAVRPERQLYLVARLKADIWLPLIRLATAARRWRLLLGTSTRRSIVSLGRASPERTRANFQ